MKSLFKFELKEDGDFEINCRGWFVSIIYPIIFILGLIIGIVVYPIFLVMWGYKKITKEVTINEKRK